MKRSPLPDPLGLSAIDLISCAFVGVLLLNLLAEQDPPKATEVKSEGFCYLEFEINTDALARSAIRIEIEAEVNGAIVSSIDQSNWDRKLRWWSKDLGVYTLSIQGQFPKDGITGVVYLADAGGQHRDIPILVRSSIGDHGKILFENDEKIGVRPFSATP